MNGDIFLPHRSVRDLQILLNSLARRHLSIPSVPVDGAFGEGTLEGVMRVQRLNRLPVTGVVDAATWEAVVAMAGRSTDTLPTPAHIYPHSEFTLEPQGVSPFLHPIQGMIRTLFGALNVPHSLPVDGTLNPETVTAIRWLQERSALPVDGTLTQDLWTVLTRLYDTFVIRRPSPHSPVSL